MRLPLLLSLAVAVLARERPDAAMKAEMEKDLMPPVMTVEEGESYIVNLACEGCPNVYGQRKAVVGDFDKGTSLVRLSFFCFSCVCVRVRVCA